MSIQRSLAGRLKAPDLSFCFWSSAYIAVGIAFLLSLLANHQCGVGFTSMIAVGDRFFPQATTEFQEAQPRIHEDSFGYDAQFYAQIALDPSIQDAELDEGVDNLRYRARRILMPAFAWLLGTGDPDRIVHVYPLINPLCWIVCGFLLLHWLPPQNLQNFIRWSGIMLGWGWITSIERSLSDGPAAALTVLAAFLVARSAYNRGALAIAASALAKDVSLLAGLAIFEKRSNVSETLIQFAARGSICVLPLFAWWLYVNSVAPPQNSSFLGSGNFALPLVELVSKIKGQWATWTSSDSPKSLFYFFSYIAMLLHILVLLVRPKWKDIWWRIGISFAILAAVLGPAVWADEPGAAPRVVLVLHIAFNILIPKTKKWLPILILGNVSVIDFPHIMEPPELSERSEICIEQGHFLSTSDSGDTSSLELHFLDGWHGVEEGRGFVRKWTKDAAAIDFRNHGDKPLFGHISLVLGTHYDRRTLVTWNGQEIGSFTHGNGTERYPLGPIAVYPGSNILQISGEEPARLPGNGDTRALGVSLFQIYLETEPEPSPLLSLDQLPEDALIHGLISDGWYDIEQHDGYAWRWNSGKGTIQVFNRSKQERTIKLAVSLRSNQDDFAHIRIDGNLIETIPTSTQLTRHVTPPITLSPGISTLTIERASPAERASQEDSRLIGNALYALELLPE